MSYSHGTTLLKHNRGGRVNEAILEKWVRDCQEAYQHPCTVLFSLPLCKGVCKLQAQGPPYRPRPADPAPSRATQPHLALEREPVPWLRRKGGLSHLSFGDGGVCCWTDGLASSTGEFNSGFHPGMPVAVPFYVVSVSILLPCPLASWAFGTTLELQRSNFAHGLLAFL